MTIKEEIEVDAYGYEAEIDVDAYDCEENAVSLPGTSVRTSVRKTSQSQPVGVSFKRGGDGSIFISKIKEDSIFAGSDLRPGMRVKSVNGISVSGGNMDLSTLGSMLSNATEKVDIVADASNPAFVTVTAIKPTKDSKVGIVIRGGSHIFISRIDPQSIFAGTAVKPGMALHSVNGVSTTGMDATACSLLLKGAEGEVSLVVGDPASLPDRVVASTSIPMGGAIPVANATPVKSSSVSAGTGHAQGVQKEKLGMATAAMILGIIGLFFFGLVFGVLAIIFGCVASGKIKKQPELYDSSSQCQATAGLTLGIIDVVAWAIIVTVLL